MLFCSDGNTMGAGGLFCHVCVPDDETDVL